MSLFRKPKVTGFQLSDFLEKCKGNPVQFLGEYKDKPILVAGMVKNVKKAEYPYKGMLSVEMEAEAKETGVFIINPPEFQVCAGQKVRVKVYISVIAVSCRVAGIHVEGVQEKAKSTATPLSLEEDEVCIVPADSFSCVRYHNFNAYDKTSVITLLNIAKY